MTPRQIFLFSLVTSGSAEFLIHQLLDLDRESKDEITIFINSPGGSVMELFAIVDTMQMISSPIRTVVMGMAASAAAVIAAAGDTRLITENSQFMLHEVSGFNYGKSSEMTDQLEFVNKLQDTLLKILSKSTGKSIDKLKAITTKTDKYFNAKEAVRFGLADRVIKKNEAQLLKFSEGINVEAFEIEFKEGGPSSVQLLLEGQFTHPVYGDVLISEKDLEQMIRNFNSRVRGIDVSIDYTHDNEDGESPAACWIKSLDIRDTSKGKGLFAQVEFTPKGQKLVKEKEYKYASADFSINYITEDGTHVPYVLHGGTLTNRPFIKGMNPIKLSEYKPKKENKTMNREELIAMLKNQFGLDVVNVQAQLTALQAEKQELENRIQELSKLPLVKDTEIADLKSKLSELNKKAINSNKTKVFDVLVAHGKVLPVQKDSIFNLFETAEDMEKFYKDAPVLVKVKASGTNIDPKNNEELTEAEQAVVNGGDYTKEEILKNRTSSK